MLTADNLAKAAGKTFKGTAGGALKVLTVKTDEQKQMTIQFEFKQPLNTIPAVPAMPLGAAPIPLPGPALPPPPAPAPGAAPAPPAPAVQAPAVKQQAVQLKVWGQFGAPVFMGPMMGLSIQDEQGNALPMQMGQQQFRMMMQPGGVNVVTATYTLICRPGKDQKEPAKLVYLGRKLATVEIPFTLKDVPLP